MAEVRVVRTDEPVAVAGAELARALALVARTRAAPRLAIPGGSAVAAVAVARAALPSEVWGRVLLTWVDERCVPFADPDSSRGEAHRTGVLRADAPVAFELPLFLDGERPEDATARVAHDLAGRFDGALDVLLLGMGEDGHVASLFPGARPIAGAVGHVADSPKPPPDRITLSRATLATAETTVLLAFGTSKRAAVQRLIEGDPDLPATGLAGLTVVTDPLPLRPGTA